jgi:hypothetical protein
MRSKRKKVSIAAILVAANLTILAVQNVEADPDPRKQCQCYGGSIPYCSANIVEPGEFCYDSSECSC